MRQKCRSIEGKWRLRLQLLVAAPRGLSGDVHTETPYTCPCCWRARRHKYVHLLKWTKDGGESHWHTLTPSERSLHPTCCTNVQIVLLECDFRSVHNCLTFVAPPPADICISCGSLNVSLAHPLFAGGMCQSCKVSLHNVCSHHLLNKSRSPLMCLSPPLCTELLPRMCVPVWRRRLPVVLHDLLRRTRGAHVWKQQLLPVRFAAINVKKSSCNRWINRSLMQVSSPRLSLGLGCVVINWD